MIREVIHSIDVWDAATRTAITFQPGTILRSCSIRCHNHAALQTGADPYVMEFETGGDRYECTLATFQPRTRPVELSDNAALAV